MLLPASCRAWFVGAALRLPMQPQSPHTLTNTTADAAFCRPSEQQKRAAEARQKKEAEERAAVADDRQRRADERRQQKAAEEAVSRGAG